MKHSATVNYHIKKGIPQSFEFDVDGIEGNLVSPELTACDIQVTDLRGMENRVSFDTDSLTFAQMASRVQEFDDEQLWQETYNGELTALLRSEIGATEVIVFDHTVRIDDGDATRRPARNVHTDYSQAGAEQRLTDIVGAERAAEFMQGSFGFVNVWRPIERPISSSPLGFIRPSSMHADDWMNIELVYPDRYGQILGVAENPEHEWLYFSAMTPQEAVIFNIYDNRGRPFLAHSALDMEGSIDSRTPRKSIESRTLVRYP